MLYVYQFLLLGGETNDQLRVFLQPEIEELPSFKVVAINIQCVYMLLLVMYSCILYYIVNVGTKMGKDRLMFVPVCKVVAVN